VHWSARRCPDFNADADRVELHFEPRSKDFTEASPYGTPLFFCADFPLGRPGQRLTISSIGFAAASTNGRPWHCSA